MKRLHLVEIHELPWIPASLRNCITGHLQFVIEKLEPYKVVFPRLNRALTSSESTKINDLCSGGGGPLLSLSREVNREQTIVMSDRYPNLPAFQSLEELSGGKISYRVESVDCLKFKPETNSFYTLFTSFHHFRPEECRTLISNLTQSSSGLAICEVTGRSPLAFLMLFPVCLSMFFVTPWVKPFRVSRLFWTYCFPAAPLIAFIDGVISNFRTYNVEQLQRLLPGEAAQYTWSIGQEKTREGLRVTYLIGVPERNDRA